MKILCAVDGSEFSQWGVETLAALSAKPPEQLILVHVVDTGSLKTAEGAGAKTLAGARAAMDHAGEQILASTLHSARVCLGQAATAPHTKIETVLTHGPVAATLLKQAARRKVDLILVGSRGLSDPKGFLLGSISRRLVPRATQPVLVVKRPLHALRRILIAVDGSRHAKAALRFVRDRLPSETAQVTLVSVVPPVVTELAAEVLTAEQLASMTKPAQAKAEALVRECREILLREGWSVHTDVRSGHPAETLLRCTEEIQPDLLVAGSRGLSGRERLVLGSVSDSLLKYAACSVLIVQGRHA